VEDLARLHVAAVVRLGRLARGKDGERLLGQGRPEGERLVGGEYGIATEERRVPRHAGSHVTFAGVGACR
jgi:hypothetical protein